jgi:hypothetical protein
MKEDNSIQNIDIEELLLSKDYDSLTMEERSFADTQVDSPQEYSELRATLLSIKQVSSDEENVLIPHRIKDELIQKMESETTFFGGIAAFLFPKDVPLFRKPGLQFASIAMLLLLVVNIGISITDRPNAELAVNNIKQQERQLPLIEEEKKEEGFYDIEINNQEPEERKEVIAKPEVQLIEMDDEVFQVEVEKVAPANSLQVLEKESNTKFKKEVADAISAGSPAYFDTKDITSDLEEDIVVTKLTDSVVVTNFNQSVAMADVATTRMRTNESTTVLMESVTLDNISTNGSKKKFKSASKSLKENEELIDFLFVAM